MPPKDYGTDAYRERDAAAKRTRKRLGGHYDNVPAVGDKWEAERRQAAADALDWEHDR